VRHTAKPPAIRLGVIGTGAAFEKLHWPVLQSMHHEFRVVAVTSRTVQTAQGWAQRLEGSTVHPDHTKLLDDPGVDAVLICVPIESSARILVDAIRSGKHVLAEKPLAATVEQGREVLQACSDTQAVLAVGENFRYRKDLAKAKAILEQDGIGKVFAFEVTTMFDLDSEIRQIWTGREWRRQARHQGGFVLDAAVHPVAYLRDLLGEVSEVYAQVMDRHPVVGGPDSLLMQLTLSSGAIGQFFACYTAKLYREVFFQLTALGSHGSLSVRPGQVEWYRADSARRIVYRTDSSDRGYRDQWRNFCRAIRGEEIVVSNCQKAFGDLQVIDAAMRSAHAGEKITIS
jgi:predicted dehydrogenase